jgi:hypothetical protein
VEGERFGHRVKGIGSGCEVEQDDTPRTRRWSRKLANKDFVLLPDFSSPLAHKDNAMMKCNKCGIELSNENTRKSINNH